MFVEVLVWMSSFGDWTAVAALTKPFEAVILHASSDFQAPKALAEFADAFEDAVHFDGLAVAELVGGELLAAEVRRAVVAPRREWPGRAVQR